MSFQWLFMVYMAGDNGRVFPDGYQLMGDLSREGWFDLEEMASVGSTHDVAIVAQFDTLVEKSTPRFFMDGSDTGLNKVDEIPAVNTGNPNNLTDFIVWAVTNHPAKRLALVLWNHGTGWEEEDIYRRYRDVEEKVRRDHDRGVRSRRRLGRSLFLSSAAEIMRIDEDETRAICYDDTSMDFLDNADLSSALFAASKLTGRRLDVLGMDACLMSMVEVAYGVRAHADFMIGSQEVEPGDGWPYGPILRIVTKNPQISASEVSRSIVKEYERRYGLTTRFGGGMSTQSALNLNRMNELFQAIRKLSFSLLAEIPLDFSLERGFNWAKQEAQRFEDKDSVDLVHFLQRLSLHYRGPVSTQIDAVLALLQSGTIEQNWHGSARSQANGLSIYCPGTGYSPFYERQAFADSGWNRLVKTINRIDDSRTT